jgi:ornithine cyclodeaminase/alanine dehydrogenase-like protein (mu-crystallin family)
MPSKAFLTLLDKHAVELSLDHGDVLAAVREAFILHSERAGRLFPVVRESLSTGGVFGIKSGGVPSKALLGLKAAGFWPGNRARGSEPHQATILLFDPATGRPQCVIDGNAITTVRTGAAGAIGLQTLARLDSECVTVFGSGVQARIQTIMAKRVLPRLRRVRYVSRNRLRSVDFEAALGGGCEIVCATDADAAVRDSDVIITATPGAGPLFSAASVQPGTHINCVGSDTRGKRELPDGVLQRSKVFVDDRRQALALGELQWASDLSPVEIGTLLNGAPMTARQPSDITIFDMTGLALQDLTVARLVYQRAADAGLGHRIGWDW